jgi:3-dehydroquinate dehydratase/shikimate dehydrogenase
MICLSLTAPSLEEACEAVVGEVHRIDLVELRADLLDGDLRSAVSLFPGQCTQALATGSGAPLGAAASGEPKMGFGDLPKILTVRRRSDGGVFRGHEEERLELLEHGLGAGYDLIDLELDLLEAGQGAALQEEAERRNVRIIRSYHDVEGVPEDLEELVARLSVRPGEIPKLAVTPRSTADLRRLLEAAPLMRERGGILIGMATFGVPTRILAPLLGSRLTYCSVGGRQAAPGHLDPESLVDVYGYPNLGPQTRVFAVIGDPVMHSKSPHYHNRVFREQALDAVYVPVHVDRLSEFFRIAQLLDIRGVSVTIPHKAEVIAHLDEVEEAVHATGACNTVMRRRDGTAWGTNTDIPGFLAPLLAEMSLDGAAVTVVGAGGAARGIVYALAREGARVLVLNRTAKRAEALRRDLVESHGFGGITAAALGPDAESSIREHNDIIVQTTSVGMAPQELEDPIEWYRFDGQELVYDIIYTPEITRLLARAREAGCRIISGLQMFRAQAEEQSRLYCQMLTQAGEVR